MRHYEAVVLFHPDQSEQVSSMVDRYIKMIESVNGSIDRQEDWGKRKLAYPIQKLTKAHYFLLNFTCDHKKIVDDLQETFKHNDAILRYFVCKLDKKPEGQSIVLKTDEEKRSAALSD